MKKLICCILSLFMVLSVLPMAAPGVFAAETSRGDFNNDGLITAYDARHLLRIAVRLEQENLDGDLNNDGKVIASDARLMLRIALGLEDPYAFWSDPLPVACNYIKENGDLFEESTGFGVSLSAGEVDSNRTFTVDVAVTNGVGMKSLDGVLSYDKNVLAIDSVDSGVWDDYTNIGIITGTSYNKTEAGAVALSGYFLDQLLSNEAFAAAAEKRGFADYTYDANNVTFYTVTFTVLPSAQEGSTEIRLNAILSADETVYASAGVEVQIPHLPVGDIDGDGMISAFDARYILRAAMHLEVLTDEQFYCADLDCNGKITAAEARFCMRMAAGLEAAELPLQTEAILAAPMDFELAEAKLCFDVDDLGDQVRVTVWASDCLGLAGADFVLRYDPALLAYESCKSAKEYQILSESYKNNTFSVVAPYKGTGAVFGCFSFVQELWSTEQYVEKEPETDYSGVNTERLAVFEIVFEKLGEETGDVTLDAVLWMNGEKVLSGCAAPISVCPHIHTREVEALAAGCLDDGFTAGVFCEDCGKYISGHMISPALGHTEVVLEAVPATCSKTGLTEGKKCTRCGVVTVEQTELPKKAHTWNAGEITKAASYTAEGEKTYTCTVCGATRTEAIPKLTAQPKIDTPTAKEAEDGVYAAPEMKAETLLSAAGAGAQILNENGGALQPGEKVGSGMTLVKPDGTKETIIVKGDNNGDGAVTAADARYALRVAVRLETPNAWQEKASHVTGSAAISAADARTILRAAVRLEALALV